jgi:hypothetical protein
MLLRLARHLVVAVVASDANGAIVVVTAELSGYEGKLGVLGAV